MLEALRRGRGGVGVVHLGMHATEEGLVGAWAHQVEAVAEPSESPLHLPYLHQRNLASHQETLHSQRCTVMCVLAM